MTPADALEAGAADAHRERARAWRVALVHDWLTGMRGGEKVLDALADLYPHADLFTMVHVRGSVSPALERRRPRAAFTSDLPLARRLYRYFLPLFPAAVEQFDLDAYDMVVSTSHCAVKSAVRTGRARHLCYCHSPMRYAWDQFDAYFGRARLGPASAASGRSSRTSDAGTRPPAAAWTAIWPIPNTLRNGFAGTIIADRPSKDMAVKMGDFLAEKVCPQSKEEELLKEMWDIATIEERKTIATLMFKMVK